MHKQILSAKIKTDSNLLGEFIFWACCSVLQTAITDGAEDEEGAADENISDEERVSSASPAYQPPSSPAVFIQPGGEVQFMKDQSPGKETQENYVG